MPNIRPSSELRNNYAGIMKQCRELKEPIFLTVNGKGDSVIMPIEEYEKEQRLKRLALMLQEAEDDIQNGRVKPADDVYNDIINELKARKDLQ